MQLRGSNQWALPRYVPKKTNHCCSRVSVRGLLGEEREEESERVKGFLGVGTREAGRQTDKKARWTRWAREGTVRDGCFEGVCVPHSWWWRGTWPQVMTDASAGCRGSYNISSKLGLACMCDVIRRGIWSSCLLSKSDKPCISLRKTLHKHWKIF